MGQLELFANKVCIRKKGVLGFLTQGLKGNKEIQISSISSIQFKKASSLTSGYIQFTFMGGQEAKGGIFQAASDENSVLFKKKQQRNFEYIKEEVEKRMQKKDAPTPSASSDADEIKKLAELRDKGILTEEKFQQKKKQVLGI